MVDAPPSIILALMAWELAWQRVHGTRAHRTLFGGGIEPVPRAGIGQPGFPFSYASPEYYAILDRINAGESPHWGFVVDVSPFTEDGRLGGPARAPRLRATQPQEAKHADQG